MGAKQTGLTHLETCLKASTMTGEKSCVNSGPFLLLFCMTSFARYRKVSLRDSWAAQRERGKNISYSLNICGLKENLLHVLLN